jgi:hypothetical protein
MKHTLIFLLCLACSGWARGQTAVLSLIGTSGDASPTFSYSIGEVVTGGQPKSGQHLTNGFQQGEIWIVGINEAEKSKVEAVLYPNPANTLLWVEVKNETRKNFIARITDMGGKVLAESKSFQQKVQLDVSEFNAGTYTVSLYSKNQIQKTFQIIKNNKN